MSSLLAAESARLETMVRFFLVAVVLVAPAAVVVARRILRSRRADDDAGATTAGTATGDGHDATPPSPGDALAELVARIDEAARTVGAAGAVEVTVSAELAGRLGDQGGPPTVERLVVDDAIRRGGLRGDWDWSGHGDGRLRLSADR